MTTNSPFTAIPYDALATRVDLPALAAWNVAHARAIRVNRGRWRRESRQGAAS